MSVSLHEILENDAEIHWFNDVDDAKWLLDHKDDFMDEMNEIFAEAEETLELYDDYLNYKEELEDSGERGKIMPFAEYKRQYDEDMLEEN